jgi:hypothetical protein
VEIVKNSPEKTSLANLNIDAFLTKFDAWKKSESPERQRLYAELRDMHQSAGINRASVAFWADEEMLAFWGYVAKVKDLKVSAIANVAAVKPASVVAPTPVVVIPAPPSIVTEPIPPAAPIAPTLAPVPAVPAQVPAPKPDKQARTPDQIKDWNSKFIDKHRVEIDSALNSYTDEAKNILDGYLDDPTRGNIMKFQKVIWLDIQDWDFRNITLSAFEERRDLDTFRSYVLTELKKINGLQDITWKDILKEFWFKLTIDADGIEFIQLPVSIVWAKPDDNDDYSLKLAEGYEVRNWKIFKKISPTRSKETPEVLNQKIIDATISDFNKYVNNTPVLKGRILQVPGKAKWTDTKDNDFSFYISVDAKTWNFSVQHEVDRDFFTSNNLNEFEKKLIEYLQTFLVRNVKKITWNDMVVNIKS